MRWWRGWQIPVWTAPWKGSYMRRNPNQRQGRTDPSHVGAQTASSQRNWWSLHHHHHHHGSGDPAGWPRCCLLLLEGQQGIWSESRWLLQERSRLFEASSENFSLLLHTKRNKNFKTTSVSRQFIKMSFPLITGIVLHRDKPISTNGSISPAWSRKVGLLFFQIELESSLEHFPHAFCEQHAYLALAGDVFAWDWLWWRLVWAVWGSPGALRKRTAHQSGSSALYSSACKHTHKDLTVN